ncbi:primase-helicase family protein [Methylobacter sp. G7]|uniref:primase-helicase family protein n=1 Tax=Methylobacter sp. G7 TaxID=3230117 RepID=UPI003D809F1F
MLNATAKKTRGREAKTFEPSELIESDALINSLKQYKPHFTKGQFAKAAGVQFASFYRKRPLPAKPTAAIQEKIKSIQATNNVVALFVPDAAVESVEVEAPDATNQVKAGLLAVCEDPLVSFTHIKSKTPVSKRYYIENRVIKKVAAAQCCNGSAKRVTIPFSDFAKQLPIYGSNEAISIGVPLPQYPDKVGLDLKGKERPDRNIISRSKDCFCFSANALALLDYDPSEYAPRPYTQESFINALVSVHPEIRQAAQVIRGSLSAGVHLEGEPPREGTGFHLNMPCVNGEQLREYTDILAKRLYIAGHGYIALSNNGSCLVRTCIDASVSSPERLVFEGKPELGEGLQYTPPVITYTAGTSLDLATLKPLSDAEEAQFAMMVTMNKAAIAAQSIEKRKVWADNRISDMVAKGTAPEKAKQIIEQMVAGGFKDLYGDFLLDFGNEVVTVSEVLRSQKKYDGRSLADPIEGAEYGTTTAIFYSNKEAKPQIHSQAHGIGTTYFLHHSKSINAINGELETREDYEIALEIHVEKFNQNQASVLYGGHNMVCRRSKDKGDNGHHALDFIPMNQFKSVYENTLIQTGYNLYGEPVFKSHAVAWHKHFNSLSYVGGVCFEPEKTVSPDKLNLWQGFTVEPVENDALLEVLKYHMLEVVCSGNAELYDYLVRWIAYTFQNPAEPAGAAVVLIGEKGIGKSLLGQFLKSLWGSHGLQITSPGLLTGKHNAHLQNVCFLFADEAFFSGDKAAEGQLKGLITEPSFTVEPKGVNAFVQQNYLKVMMATNNTFAVPASRDERRYCVFDVSSKHRGDQPYFNSLHASLSAKETKQAFLHWMKNVDLTGWRTSMIPDSIGLRSQRYQSMGTIQKWIVDGLLNGSFGTQGHGDYWQTELGSNELFAQYVTWCDTAKVSEYKRNAQCVLSSYLGKVFAKKIHVDGVRGKRGFVFGTLADAIEAFETYEKVSLSELDD